MFSSKKRANLFSIQYVFSSLVICTCLLYFHTTLYTQIMSIRIRLFDVFMGVQQYVIAWRGASSDVDRLYLQNMKLENDLAKLKSFESSNHLLKEENSQLRALVGNRARVAPKFAAKPKIIHQRHNYHHMILPSSVVTIAKGSLVREHNHVVGLVEDALSSGVVVRLITDSKCSIPVSVEHSTLHGIIRGNYSNTLSLEHVPYDANIHVGDKLYANQQVHEQSKTEENTTSRSLIGFVSSIEQSKDKSFLQIDVQPAMRLDYDSWYVID